MINGKASVLGLLGPPVNHSLSPLIHNTALPAMDLNWCYLAMPCEAKDLGIVTKALREINCKGLNITIPHKEEIIGICDYISPLANRLGAVNTLIPNQDQGWNGENTDVEGFLAPLKSKQWQGGKAIVLGCGGSARAVIAGLEYLNFQDISIIGRKQLNINKFLQIG